MLILTAQNITKVKGKPAPVREDGTADYDVWIGINHVCIWKGRVIEHDRAKGASALLRLIAKQMEWEKEEYANCLL